MLYKKYIRIKNVVDEELDRKYNNVKKAVGSNNKQIKQLKKDASELINTPNNDTNTLQEKINNNSDKIAENRVEMVDNNFQEINKVFKYESGFIVGGNAGQLRIGSDNIQLNVPNPVQVRVCDEQSCDSNIFTMRNTEDSIPVVINENVDSGVDCLGTNVDNITISSDGIVNTTIEISAIGINNIFGQANSELTNVLSISSNLNGNLEVGFNLLGQTYTGGELLTITNINDGAYINISDPLGESEIYDITKDLDGCYIITKRTSS
jgi:hypothetical protein